MSIVDLQKYWTDHSVVTDQMVMDLKEELKIKPYEGLMIVKNENHEKAFKEPIPEGFVAWLIVDNRIPRMTGYFLNDDNVCYTTPYGENGMRRK
tara:strand:- start:4534 stop:4815 length:282 start_codon:yes stop_codon:yes gene_type:complete